MNINKHTVEFLDRNVIFVFIGTFVIFGSILLYNFLTYFPCEEVTFSVKAQKFEVGALIKFSAETPDAENWKWDFGDQTIESSKEALHIYNEPGNYDVTLRVNSNCEITKSIIILEKEVVIDSTKFPVFELPKTIRLGQTLTVEDQTPNASSWEWRFGETASANAVTQRARYKFKEPGLKTVSLVVNGDLNYITKKRIEVLPIAKRTQNPNPPVFEDNLKSAPKTVPYINEVDFANKLLLVSEGTLSSKEFSNYFCGDLNKNIIVNGKNTTFLLFCEKIYDTKIKLKKIELFRNEGSNCVKTIIVDYKKTFLF